MANFKVQTSLALLASAAVAVWVLASGVPIAQAG